MPHVTRRLIFALVPALVALFCVANASAPVREQLSHIDVVQRYLRNGGHDRLRRHLDLPPGVQYNPLLHMSRDDGPYRADHPVLNGTTLTDVELLRELGHFVPGFDDDALLTTSRIRMRTSSRQTEKQIRGRASLFFITYRGSPPREARDAFEYAMRIWADTFDCKTPLRVLFNWASISGRTLAAAVSPFTVGRDVFGARALLRSTAYTPTMAAAVSGTDFIPGRNHIEISFNNQQRWHFDFGRPAPRDQFDFATVAIHEGCHGLFFTGALLGSAITDTARFESYKGFPSRFDQFMQTSTGVGVARSCDSPKLFKALTTPGLSFLTVVFNSTFALYAPENYQQGSSTYHFDAFQLKDDCSRAKIRAQDCSNLMTFELDTGYTQHKIGEPTLRVMKSVLGKSQGIVKSTCKIPPPVRSASQRRPGLLGLDEEMKPLNFPLWVIITAASVAGVGAILVLYFVVTALIR